jgi:hypothetical protein
MSSQNQNIQIDICEKNDLPIETTSPIQNLPIQPPNTPDETIYDKIINFDEMKEKVEKKVEKKVEQKRIHSQFHLEEGDYFPFVKIKYVAGGQKEMHNFVDDHDFAIIHVKNIEQIKTIKRHPKINTIILFKEGSPTS